MNHIFYVCKKHIQRSFQNIGLEVRRARPPVNSIDIFPLVIHDLMRQRGNELFLIQVGAHDGVQFDPIRPWIEKYKWKGILVEPQPDVFKRLCENYRHHPQVILENCAVASSDREIPFYQFRQDGSIPEHASVLASFDRKRLEHNGFGYKGTIDELKIRGMTPRSLLEKHRVKKVDLLQLDAEGFDFEILQLWDFKLNKPSVIHYESGTLDADTLFASYNLLTANGYKLATVGVDTIAYLQETS